MSRLPLPLNRIDSSTGQFSHHPECSVTLCFCFVLDERDYLLTVFQNVCKLHSDPTDPDFICTCNLCRAYMDFLKYKDLQNDQATPSTN